MSLKIKVFLGAYINQSNAQNLNCLTLSKYIDKDKFDVYTLAIKHGNFGRISIPGVKIFTCWYPVKISQYIAFLWGVCKCDVAYLPRGNSYKYQRFLLRLFKKRSFKTIENVIDSEALSSALSIFKDKNEMLSSYNFVDRLYSITNYMYKCNYETYRLKTEPFILPLATDTTFFNQIKSIKSNLNSIIFLGNDMRRKRVSDYIYLASKFPDLIFNIIGSDSIGIISDSIKKYSLKNVVFHGSLPHQEMLSIIRECDLQILPSKSEGFPRGIIELSAAGIPCITYKGYGAEEWIRNFENGVVCSDVAEIEECITKFIQDNKLLEENSIGALQLAEKYSARNVTNMYENVIIDLHDC